MLLGVILPDAEQDPVGHELPAIARRRSARSVVAGHLPLPENLTVFESLEIFAGFYGIRRPGAVVRCGRALRPGRPSPAGPGAVPGQRTLVGIVKPCSTGRDCSCSTS
jgi:hypothetical protein